MLKVPRMTTNVARQKENAVCYFCRQKEPAYDLRYETRTNGWTAVHSTCNGIVQKYFYRHYRAILDVERANATDQSKLVNYFRLRNETDSKLDTLSEKIKKSKLIFGEVPLALEGEQRALLSDHAFIMGKINDLVNPVLDVEHPDDEAA